MYRTQFTQKLVEWIRSHNKKILQERFMPDKIVKSDQGPHFSRKDLVIMVHMGDQDHLKDILDIAIYYGNTVLLVGDETNRKFVDNRNSFHFLSDNYSKRANEFKKIHENYSTLSQEWEIRSLANIFILHEFMKTHKIENCFHCEADCALLVPVKSLNFDPNINYTVKAKGFGSRILF